MEVNITKCIDTPDGRRFCRVVFTLCLAKTPSGRKISLISELGTRLESSFRQGWSHPVIEERIGKRGETQSVRSACTILPSAYLHFL